jgi:hypothetical protein
MVLLDASREPLSDMRIVDLIQETTTAEGKPLEIVGSLEPDSYGIDMSSMQL